ncbi:MAG: right-handed parallel beta-helix repeat-containing protein, partial [Roseiflexaceae bacterium]|nr:right-handed parallel beta-helix repeat-containing protein [Roseiflexaceae bacterium]
MQRSKLVTLRLLTFAFVFLATLAPIEGVSRAQAAVQYTFYAAPDGAGTTCSLIVPCSLGGARDKVRSVNNSMTGDIVVYLRGGTYQLTSTFALDQNDSGNNGYTVTYQAYTGEIPIISGGQSITGWTQSGSLWQASVGGIETRQLYVNG